MAAGLLAELLRRTFLGNSPWIHRRFIVIGYADRVVQDKGATLGVSSGGKEEVDGAGHRRRLGATVYQDQPPGTAFEGTISLRIRDDTVIAQGTAQGGSNGVKGEFKANLQFNRRPNQRLGVVEAFEDSASGSGEVSTWTEFRSSSASRG